jgi:hydrogenase nickel insertion protein HypA
MHEYSIVAALLAQVDEQAAKNAASRVHRLTVSIGELAGVDVQLLETAFSMFRERSICEDAELVIREVAADWRCPRCDEKMTPGQPLRCTACDMPACLVAGDEIILDRIEMEVSHV